MLRSATMDHVIESADEFVRLRRSSDEEEYRRAAHEEAPLEVWHEVIERFPNMRQWVAHNKTVRLTVLEVLRHDPDEDVQWAVRMKRSWARAHPENSLRQTSLQNTRKSNQEWKRHT